MIKHKITKITTASAMPKNYGYRDGKEHFVKNHDYSRRFDIMTALLILICSGVAAAEVR